MSIHGKNFSADGNRSVFNPFSKMLFCITLHNWGLNYLLKCCRHRPCSCGGALLKSFLSLVHPYRSTLQLKVGRLQTEFFLSERLWAGLSAPWLQTHFSPEYMPDLTGLSLSGVPGRFSVLGKIKPFNLPTGKESKWWKDKVGREGTHRKVEFLSPPRCSHGKWCNFSLGILTADCESLFW